MILLDDVVEVFDLADLDVRFILRVVAFDRRGVGAALVDRDLLGRAMTADRLVQTINSSLGKPAPSHS